MKAPRQDWRTWALAVGSGGGGILALAFGVMAAAYIVISKALQLPGPESLESINMLILAADLILIAVVAMLSSYHAVKSIRSDVLSAASPRRVRWWTAVGMLLVGAASSLAASFLVEQKHWQLLAPVFQVFAVGAPVYVLARVAIAGLASSSKLRIWGTVTTGMFVGTGISILAELVLLLLVAIVGVLILVLIPSQLAHLQELAQQLGRSPTPEHALEVLGPLITSPLSLVGVLAVVSGMIPIIEEFAKSIACWAIFDRLSGPAQGFSAGALSGAGFALLEGLLTTAEPTSPWASILILRAGSSLMHIFASGLVGWGIGSFAANRRFARVISGYAGAMAIHATWNASVIALGYSALRTEAGNLTPDAVAILSGSLGSLLLLGLLVALPVGLVLLNRRLRNQLQIPMDAPLAGDSTPARARPPES